MNITNEEQLVVFMEQIATLLKDYRRRTPQERELLDDSPASEKFLAFYDVQPIYHKFYDLAFHIMKLNNQTNTTE